MGHNCRRDCVIALIVLNAWLWQLVEGSSISSSERDSFLYDYAFKKIKKLRSGEVYDVAPPANFSGVEVAVARVRRRSLWRKGLTIGAVAIPARTLPRPFTRRVDLVYQNLGNWSSHYYDVPNHTFVAPVLGFLAYDSNGSGAIELRGGGDDDPLLLNFSGVAYGGVGGATRCVRFDRDGRLELEGTTRGSSCVVRAQGHFSLVVPRKAKRGYKWWVVGVGGGALGLVGVVLVVVGWKRLNRKKIKKMEQEAERCVGLETMWIGRSRMPFASGIRTQPVLENSYLP
ncbi:uncharacterized protein LOC131020773 [Salvia miltiorrhiza]|uniref:uncharacterized protein LOC131020773 n=1 Tax=Salvia miltiorrhiza TaxID=226208 RepID=UPI0025AD4605|nr:uncharacterized protein LOC131020773 [Salvia miltiorrhiza]